MSEPEDPSVPEPVAAEPMFGGMPVVVRLVTGDDVACVIGKHARAPQMLIMDRPLHIYIERVPKQPRGRIRFGKWQPFTDAMVCPIYDDAVLCITPLSKVMINAYMEWADLCYPDDQPEDPLPPPTEQSPKEQQDAYADYLLANFEPKGKPN